MVAMPVGMTAEELLMYDGPERRVELVRGKLVVREPAGYHHGDTALRIGTALSIHLDREKAATGWAKRRGHLAGFDPGFTIARNPDTVRAPDIAYVSRERHPGRMPDGYPEFAPDLAVEVRSPNDRASEVMAKIGEWLAAGTQVVWRVDPLRDQVIVYRADGSVTVLNMGDTLDGESLLPGFTLPLAELFVDDD